MNFEKVEKFRYKLGIFESNEGNDFGLFFIPVLKSKAPLKVLCAHSDNEWQHVSVSLPHRTPTWDEMCKIKDLFWDKSETVIQFHPSIDQYVNNHPHCLHLWRHKDGHELPPSILVGD